MSYLKSFSQFLLFIFVSTLFLTSCDKNENDPDNKDKGTLTIKMYDQRTSHSKSGSDDIIETEKLTKFIITISSVSVKKTSDEVILLTDTAKNIDLLTFQGTPQDLFSQLIPLGSYKSIIIQVSGVDMVYDGNSYTANASDATVTFAAHPGFEFNSSQGVVNAFSTPKSFEYAINFELVENINYQTVNLNFDVAASCYEIEFVCPYNSEIHLFAGVRPNLTVGAFLEQGIQQIRHSPPYVIDILSNTDVEYYGIHTFVDFDSIGGTINSHTSQHVFRGEDGTLLIDAEPMAVNTTALSPNAVSAIGETDVTANEVFKTQTIYDNLVNEGYTLEAGKTYYFSLRKTWNITTNGTTYDLTRICEPIPVVWYSK